MRILSQWFLGRGDKKYRLGELEAATKEYEMAARLSSGWSVPWFCLGMIHKHRLNWVDSLRCSVRAVDLDPTSEGGWWNSGIAATALKDWRVARAAWRKCGIDVPAGDGAVEMELGPVPIRINPRTDGEVVWCDRIDPARAIIRNIPFPQSNHRYRDLLLHDGEPNGYRMHNGHEVPVFDELQILKESDFGTYHIVIRTGTKHDVNELEELCEAKQCEFEDWSENVRMLCRECSEGRPHKEHEVRSVPSGQRQIGVAARSEGIVRDVLGTWRSIRPDRDVIDVDLALPPGGTP